MPNTLHYREFPAAPDVDAELPAVLLLHGLFGMSDNLNGVARCLQQHARVFSLDLVNHGRSPHVDSVDLPSMAGDIAGFMQQHSLERVMLLGHSLGGKVAMQLALQTPQQVAALIVADIAPVDYPDGHQPIFAALKAVEAAAVQTRRQADDILQRYIAPEGVRQFLLKSLQTAPEQAARWRFNVAGLENSYPQLRAAPQPGGPYTGPCLFIKGALSDYIQDKDLPAIGALFPAFTLASVDGAGHWLHAEQPARFNRLVEDFLLSLRR